MCYIMTLKERGYVMADVAVIMGSKSDWPTMVEACRILDEFKVSYVKRVISAHRMPDEMFGFSESARENQLKVIIAGAGGAAHLPGMVASKTTLPVIGVPVQSRALSGLDSLLSIVQMPGGIPVATTAIGQSGAKNAALLAVQILSIYDEQLAKQLDLYRQDLKRASIESSDQLD